VSRGRRCRGVDKWMKPKAEVEGGGPGVAEAQLEKFGPWPSVFVNRRGPTFSGMPSSRVRSLIWASIGA
jgi:hypothetical protein